MPASGRELVGRIREYLKKTDLADGLLVFVEENSDPYAVRITGIENSTATAIYMPKTGPTIGITSKMECASLNNVGVLDEVHSYDKPEQFNELVKPLMKAKKTALNFSTKEARTDFLSHSQYEHLECLLEGTQEEVGKQAFISADRLWKELGYHESTAILAGGVKEARAARLCQLKNIDGLVLVAGASPANDTLLNYVSGVRHARRAALVASNGKGTLIVHSSEMGTSGEEFDEILTYSTDEEFEQLLSNKTGKKILITPGTVTEGNYRILTTNGKTLESAETPISAIMAVKLKSEVEAVRAGCKILDEIVNEVFSEISAGDTERKIYDKLLVKIRSHGLEPTFNPMVAIGKNSANVHHLVPTDEKAENGTNILIDAGVVVAGMGCDKKYNAFFGEPPPEYIEAYKTAEKAFLAAFSRVKSGQSGGVPDKAARDVLVDAGYPDFKHGTGHSLGFRGHDVGTGLRLGCKDVLLEGQIVTIEPGVEIEGKWGVRIETDVLVKTDGTELLGDIQKLTVRML